MTDGVSEMIAAAFARYKREHELQLDRKEKECLFELHKSLDIESEVKKRDAIINEQRERIKFLECAVLESNDLRKRADDLERKLFQLAREKTQSEARLKQCTGELAQHYQTELQRRRDNVLADVNQRAEQLLLAITDEKLTEYVDQIRACVGKQLV